MIAALRALSLLFALLWVTQAHAAVATIYVDTGGCQTGSTTRCSGTTDSASASASGAAATITCSAVAGPAAAPGCSITGSAGQLAAIPVDGSQALFVNCATNTAQKIFFINAVDDGAGLVGTTTTPTGCTAASSDWGIGGRYIFPGSSTVNSIEGALRAGDTVVFNNTPATKTGVYITTRTAGDSSTGVISVIGKIGVRPVLEVTNTSNVISVQTANFYFGNMEVKQGGASGDSITIGGSGADVQFDNIKVSDGGGNCISAATSFSLLRSELTGCGGAGLAVTTSATFTVFGTYIHANAANGITVSGNNPNATIINSVVTANTGRGVIFSGAATLNGTFNVLAGNTIANNTDSGLEVADADYELRMANNIFQENGDAANEYNVEWTAGSAALHGFHYNNLYYHSNCQGSGTGGPACVSGLTPNSTEQTATAGFTNAGAGDFSISRTGSAFATGYPGVLLGGSTGYMSSGAVQPQSTSGGGRCIGC